MNDDTNKKQTDDDVLRASGVEIVDDSTVAKLEEEFQKELAPHPKETPHTSDGSFSLSKNKERLEKAEKTLEKEITEAEADVRGKLANLKQIRGEIEAELEQIKTWQAAKAKIEEEEKKIKDLEDDRQKVEEEITALEEGVLKNID
jgi:DNA repair exonuclease SbcCD ATPase subunit